MKFALKLALAFFLIILGCAAWIWREATLFLDTPPQTEGKEVYFDVRPGAGLPQIARELAQKGLITDARKFAWLARYKKMDNRLQAGRFALNSGWLPSQVLDILVNGKPVLFRVTIPEGLTWWQTGRLLEDEGFLRFEDFRELMTDPEFLRRYGIPFASAEGFLMPDTYLLKKPDSAMPVSVGTGENEEEASVRREWRAQARAVAGRLIDNFWRKSSDLWPAPENSVKSANAASQSLFRPPAEDLKRWVILASIVEKETGNIGEKARVAGVYTNRMSRSMLLQADPTVIYGLGSEFGGKLRRVHLEDANNLYNTYQRPGWPPGPIASFGLTALKAAINPEKHDFLYFVSAGDGSNHNFSRNYDEHLRAVREYRDKSRNKPDRIRDGAAQMEKLSTQGQ